MFETVKYSPELILYAANKFYKEKNYEEALIYYTKYLKINPKHIKSILYAGVCFSRTKDYYSAKRYFKRAIALEPCNAFAYYCYGILEHNYSEYESAMKLLNKALDLETIDNPLPRRSKEFRDHCKWCSDNEYFIDEGESCGGEWEWWK